MRLDYDRIDAWTAFSWRPPMAVAPPVIDGDAALAHLRAAIDEGKMDEFGKSMVTLAIAFHGVYAGQLTVAQFEETARACALRITTGDVAWK